MEIFIAPFELSWSCRWTFLLLLLTAGLSQAQDCRFVWLAGPDSKAASTTSDLPGKVLEAGFNGVVVPGVMEGAAWYPSQLLPGDSTHETSLQDLETFRAAGLKVAVSFQAFIHGGDTGRKNHLARVHSDWLSCDWEGKSLEAFLGKGTSSDVPFEGLFLDPGVPRVGEFLQGLLVEAANRLHPDWIILDQVRYPLPDPASSGSPLWTQPYGFHVASRKAFENALKADPLSFAKDQSKGNEAYGKERAGLLRQAWDAWRREAVTRYVQSVRELLRRDFPNCKLAVTGYPDPLIASRVAMQDWPDWIRKDLVDAVLLPDNAMEGKTAADIGLLDPDLRSRIWISGPIRDQIDYPKILADRMSALSERPGVVLFDASLLAKAGVPEKLATAWKTGRFKSNPPVTKETPPAEPEHRSHEGLEGIKALYAFQPEAPPFKGLSPNQVAAKLKELGFNAVFGGSSYPAMQRALELAHIKRFAEFPLFVGEKNWQRDPSSQPIASNGRKIRKQGWYAPVCPNTEWLRKEKMETLLRVLRDQGLDGVWLDFIRFPVFWEEVPPFLADTCFCPTCLAAFEKKTGIHPVGESPSQKADGILTNHSTEWHRWRADTILEYVDTLVREIRRISPNATVGAFVLPWKEDEYDNALYRVAGQDLSGFAKKVDVLSPMLYFHELQHPPSWVQDRTADIARRTEIPVLPIVQCFDQPTPISPPDLKQAVGGALQPPSSGVILFSQKHLEDGKKWDLTRECLAQGVH
jgi:uncharacterized lipoprotein YddW (UPF0748 family)